MGAVSCAITEAADGNRPHTLVRGCRLMGWGVLQDRSPWWMGECAIAYDLELDVAWWKAMEVGPDLGPGLPSVAILAVFDDPATGLRYLTGTSHLPSAVEGDMARKRHTQRVGAYQRAALNYRREVRKARRKHRPDVSAVGADWNLNGLHLWARVYIRSLLPGHRLLWSRKGGTHGPRQIDLFLVWLSKKARRVLRRPVRSRILPKHRHSDHRGVALQLRLRRRRRRILTTTKEKP
ncbi:hypothetical protein [Nocardioides lijunqiniae]|uniref:hypothetical protein n=1 Tax=Nocardioides lijunqiniae TaxID=2760832 RepID=UPI001877FE7C|nr:hypothetical protein [Nocardioides lijunqiniae]